MVWLDAVQVTLAPLSSTWQYDLAGRLISEEIRQNGVLAHSTQYQHDAVGNVIQKTSNGITSTYQYDLNDRLTSENNGGQVTSYSYDQQGNTLSETRSGFARSFVYNSQNQLISATVNGQSHQFGYDAEGIRNKKITNGVQTQFVTDKNRDYAQVLAEYSNNGVIEYTYGDTLISQRSNQQRHYRLKDGLGSTKALADASGTITDSYAYDAYGEMIARTGSTATHYQYAGEQFDADLGMYYNRARYYDQSIGRFSQMDSWQGQANLPITLNKYVYANANPVMYTDPSGMYGDYTVSGLMTASAGHANLQNAKKAENIKKVQSMAANLCKNASQLASRTHTHHSYLVLLGNSRSKGNKGDVEVNIYIHNELHKIMDLMFVINDLPHPKNSKSGGRKGYQQLYNSSRSDWEKAMRVAYEVSNFVDETCEPIAGPKYNRIAPKIEAALKLVGAYK